jgi:hypothetical protein
LHTSALLAPVTDAAVQGRKTPIRFLAATEEAVRDRKRSVDETKKPKTPVAVMI